MRSQKKEGPRPLMHVSKPSCLPSTLGKALASGFQFHFLLTESPWVVGLFTSLGLRFLTCKTGITCEQHIDVSWELSELMRVRKLAGHLTRMSTRYYIVITPVTKKTHATGTQSTVKVLSPALNTPPGHSSAQKMTAAPFMTVANDSSQLARISSSLFLDSCPTTHHQPQIYPTAN